MTNIILEALGNVDGCVFNAQGQPVAGALVAGGFALEETDANGCFLIEGVPAGKRKIEAGNPVTLRRGSADVEVLGGQTITAEIRLEARATILGRVLDANGNPVPEATVRLPRPDGFIFVFANDGGFFRFPDLQLGDYLIQAPGPSKQGLIIFMIEKGIDPNTAMTACDIAPGCHDFPIGGAPPASSSVNSALETYKNAVQTLFTEIVDPQLTGVGSVPAGGFGWNKVRLFQDSTTVTANVRFLAQGFVSGTTVDSNGLETGAVVRLLALGVGGTGFPKFQEFARITTDPETGEFEFSGIPRFDADTFQATGIRSGNFNLEAANPFSPARVRFSGQLNVNNPNRTDILLQFPPQSETNGDVTGTVFLPDGVTPAPEDTEVAISFGDLVIRTDADGRFGTQNQLLPGASTYTLTATAPNGLQGRILASVLAGESTDVEIRLLGLGDVKVNVVRPDGQPVVADLKLKRLGFPGDQLEALTDANGLANFFNVTEGIFGIEAVEQGTGLTGRVSDTVVRDDEIEVTLTIRASGTVTGRFVAADGATPIANAQISLATRTGTKAFTSTDNEGRFDLNAIAIGTFNLEGNNPLTGRFGRATGELFSEGETTDVTIIQLPRGTVEGVVVQNDGTTVVPGAHINIIISGIGALRLQATTRSDGSFRFDGVTLGTATLNATDPVSGFKGTAKATINFEGEIVNENVIIEGFGAVHVQVLDPDGLPVDNAEVILSRSGSTRIATVDTNGEFTFEFLRLGDYKLIANSLANSRNAGTATATINEPNETADATITLRGVGDVVVTVEDPNGVAVPTARVLLDAQASFGSGRPGPGSGAFAAFFTDASGTVTIPGVPVGDFFVKGESGAVSGLETGSIATPNATVPVTIQLGGSGSIIGNVLLPDGVTPAAQTIATLEFISQSGLRSGVLQVNTDLSGSFGTADAPRFDGIPLGPWTLSLFEIVSAGVRTIKGSIDFDGQQIALNDIVLDNTAPFVEQITPEDGASAVPLTAGIVIDFNEPLQPITLRSASVTRNLFIQSGDTIIPGILEFSNDNATATFTPNDPLESSTLYKVTILGVPNGPKDEAGLELLDPFISTFITQDTIPPTVEVSPRDGERQVLPEALVRLEFSEAMASTFDLTVTDDSGQLVEGQTDMALGDTVAIFTPTDFLKPNTRYTVTLANATDLVGNPLVGGTFTSEFFTVDTIAPVINLLQVVGAPSLLEGTAVTVQPDITGDDVDRVEYLIDGENPAVISETPFALDFTLPVGESAVTISASAVDVVGNRAQLPTELTINIVDNAPPSVSLTNLTGIADVVRGQTINFEIVAADDSELKQILFSVVGEATQTSIVDVPEGETDATELFSLTIPGDALSNGTITVQALAIDDAGQESVPAGLTLNVLDTEPPTVSISNIVDNSLVIPGQLTVVVAASDDIALQSVALVCEPNVTGCTSLTLGAAESSTIQIFTIEIPNLAALTSIELTPTATDTSGNATTGVAKTLRLADAIATGDYLASTRRRRDASSRRTEHNAARSGDRQCRGAGS